MYALVGHQLDCKVLCHIRLRYIRFDPDEYYRAAVVCDCQYPDTNVVYLLSRVLSDSETTVLLPEHERSSALAALAKQEQNACVHCR